MMMIKWCDNTDADDDDDNDDNRNDNTRDGERTEANNLQLIFSDKSS